MEVYLIYFLKVITLQTILFGLYWIFNRNGKIFLFNRYFLISTLILPFFIPLLNIPFDIFQKNIAAESVFDPWFLIEQSLPVVTINGSQAISANLSWWTIALLTIYLLVAIPSALNLVFDYRRIHRLSQSSSKREYTSKGFSLLYVPTKILSFSFLNKIFLSDQFPLKNHEKKTIVTHEEYHLTQRHSLDIILSELVRILCWFNPIIFLIQKNLKETHEYLADRHTIKHYGRNDYALLLKSYKWQEINMMLGSAYSSASIKKRLNMMGTPNKKSPFFQILIMSTIAIFTSFLFACEDNLDSLDLHDVSNSVKLTESELQKEIEKTVERIKFAPPDFIEQYKQLQLNNPYLFYSPEIVVIVDKNIPRYNNIPKTKVINGLTYTIHYIMKLSVEETTKYYSDKAFVHPLLKNKESHIFIRSIDRGLYTEHRKKMNHIDVNVYSNLDKPAQYYGGQSAFNNYLIENLRYPEVAKEKGIEDKLVMRFVVNHRGDLVYLNVDQEPSTNDEEVSLEFQRAAYQILRATDGKWQPAEKDGKYVMSKLTLPIEFKLGE